MPVLGPDDPLPVQPSRILIGGTSGSGKSTLARQLAQRLGVPYTEIDALFHGAGWTPRPEFVDDVRALVARDSWITEYQYDDARPLLLGRADLVVYLLLGRWRVMRQVVARTARRALGREVLWNGNVEPPLRSVLTDRDHVIRWAWRSHRLGPARVAEIAALRPELPVVVLRSRREVEQWLARGTR